MCSPLILAEKALVLAHQMSVRILPVYIPTEENILADAASRFQELPDLHLHPNVFQAIAARWGLPVIDLFASNASKQTKRFYSWNAFDKPEGVDALSQKWDFSLAYAFPPIALLKRVVKKLEMSRGTFILVSPLWEAQTWLVSLLTLKVLEVCRLPFLEDLVTDLTMGKPPPILHKLHLVAWRISGGSTPSQATPKISSRQGGADPQRIDTTEPGNPSRDIFVPPTFHSIKLV
jgi:hypothetical protein